MIHPISDGDESEDENASEDDDEASDDELDPDLAAALQDSGMYRIDKIVRMRTKNGCKEIL